MIATIEYIERKFNEYNEQMFEGKLHPLPFKTTSARTFLGQVRFYQEKQPDGTMRYMNFQFVISTKVDLSEAEVEDTIIHEMIHYWILSNQMQDTGPHGDIFKRKMKEINLKFNRNLSVVHKATKEEADQDKEVRQHLICVVRLKTNQMGICIANKSRLFQLWDEMPNFPKAVECNWYVSTDPFFNRFPRSSSAKLYPISVEELEAHNKDFQPLVRTGNNIRIAKR